MKVEENDVMEKRIVELEVECDNLNDEKTRLEMKLELEKENTAKLKETIISKEMKWEEENEKIRKKCTKIEVEKRKLEIDLKRVASDELLIKFKETKEVVERLHKSTQEKENEIKCLMDKVEDESNKLLLKKQKSLKLGKRIHALEETLALEAKIQKRCTRRTSAEKRMDEVQGMVSDLLRRIDECDKAKKDMHQEISNLKKKKEVIKNEVVGLFGMIASLEEEKKEMKEEVEQRKIDAQAYKMVFDNEKRKMDAKFQEQKTKIEKQEKEKKKMEANFMEMKKEIGVEVMEFEEKKRLVGRIESLKEEKKEMEAKLSRVEMAFKKNIEKILMNLNDKDEAIKILMEENTTLENKKKEIELEKIILRIKIERD